MGGEARAAVLRIAGAPADVPVGNVAQLFLEAADSYRKPDALRYKRDGSWHDISHQQVYDDVRRVALGLTALGVEFKYIVHGGTVLTVLQRLFNGFCIFTNKSQVKHG